MEIRPRRWREVRPPVRAVVLAEIREAYVGALGEQCVLTDLEIAFGQIVDQIRSGKQS